MSTAADYKGRTIDVLAFRGQRAQGDTRLSMTLVDHQNGGEVCTGAQMVAQAWLLEFLKEQDSAAHDDGGGCPFMTDLRAGRMLTEMDVFQRFNLSSSIVRRNLIRRELATDPSDERFSDAILLQVVVSPGFVTLRVEIRTQAGTSRPVVLPISTVP